MLRTPQSRRQRFQFLKPTTYSCIIAPAFLLFVWDIIAKTPVGYCGNERIMIGRSPWLAHSLCDLTNTALSSPLGFLQVFLFAIAAYVIACLLVALGNVILNW